jgi:PEP-CTERM motif
MKRIIFCAIAVTATVPAFAIVFPTGAHVANNFIPFGSGLTGRTPTMHQVFAASLFSAQTGGLPANITSIAFAPGAVGTFALGQVTINLGYTNAIPGQGSGTGGLFTPTEGGGGNFVGASTTFWSNPVNTFTFTSVATSNFQMAFAGTPFVYNPANGNLLVEIIVPGATNTTLTVSRAAGSAESSRAYEGTRFANGESPTTATRMDFQFTAVPEPATMAVLGLGIAALLRRKRK